jgi:hypothetical protein
MNRIFPRLAIAAAAFAIAACGNLLAPSDRRQRTELEHSWRLWQARRSLSYEYVQQRLCYCALEATAAVRLTVLNDVVVMRRYEDMPEPIPQSLNSLWGTVDDLFRLVEGALDMRAASLLVTYHSTLGYPTHISIDYSTAIADDELVITATALRPLALSVAAR